MTRLTRRKFLGDTLSLGALLSLSGCSVGVTGGSAPRNDPSRLTARPRKPSKIRSRGTASLGLERTRDGHLLVPRGYDPAVATPLLLSLHGAGTDGREPIELLGPYANEFGFILVAPDSRSFTWDRIHGAFGPDIKFINRALDLVFDSCFIDPHRIFIEGFSDGASYALSVGLANSDLFRRIVAFSAGSFALVAAAARPKPEIFISHGLEDQVLSFENTRFRIVPALETAGYTVEFVPYEGGHSVTAAIARRAVEWLMRSLSA